MYSELIIYKVTNTLNGKIYIGATSKSIEERKKDHLQKALNGVGSNFQKAIAKYNPDKFIWEKIDTAQDLNELAEKEKFYIQLYKSNDTGYNSDAGGGFKKSVFQYNCNGDIVASYLSLKDVETQLHIDKRRISEACTHSTLCNGSFWSYKTNDTFKNPIDSKKRKVFQYDMNGNLLNFYESVSVASKRTGLSKTCISRCCRTERNDSGGFIWRY